MIFYKLKEVILKTFLFLGITVLGLNIFGHFKTLRNDDIYSEEKNVFKDDITLTEDEFYEAVKRKDNVSTQDYLFQVTQAVNQGIAHYWWDEGIEKYNLRIPVYDNYLFFFSKWVYPKYYAEKHEFSLYKKAVERGVGLCSQHAMILSDVLNENGIKANVVRLSGHVVTTAEVDDSNNIWWVLDADYGVIIRHSIGEIEASPELVRPIYELVLKDETELDYLVDKYGEDGNSIEQNVNLSIFSWTVEEWFYLLKWVIPLTLISIFFIIRAVTAEKISE